MIRLLILYSTINQLIKKMFFHLLSLLLSSQLQLSDSIIELNREKMIRESEINTMRDQLESNKQEVHFII